MTSGPVRLLHASDTHLGHHPDNDRSVELLVVLARRHAVHAVLLVGDIFDHNRLPADFGQPLVDRLGEADVPVIVLPGNHDPLAPDSIWKRLRLPPNVRVLAQAGGEALRLDGANVVIWGRPLVDYFDVRPLEGIPRRQGDAWHVALAHGHVTATQGVIKRSYIITPEEIAGTGWDYIALGHWDSAADVSAGGVTAVYSGSPSRAGACALVTLDETAGVRSVGVERLTWERGKAP
jgi:DNA repair exonuclease SbcCD nuclease subunit